MIVEAILLKICFGFEELEKLKQQPHFSNYVIIEEMEEEAEMQCFAVQIEEW